MTLAVEHPAIQEVLDLQTGQHHPVAEVISSDYAEVMKLRMALRTQINKYEPLYSCSLCGIPVYLVSCPDKQHFFFRHELEDDRCPARTRGELSQLEINARKYNGAKESALHRRMKDWVVQCLSVDPRFSQIRSEDTWKGSLGQWRRPDVQARYGDIPVIFEIQLSTTYLNVIAERRQFYLQEGALLFWIFAQFEDENRRLTQDDVFFNNNQNAFIVNRETVAASLEQATFHLECIWAQPASTNLSRQVVAFHDLTLDLAGQRAFYFDYDKALQAWQKQESAPEKFRLKAFEDFWLDYVADNSPVDLKSWGELRRQFIQSQFVLPEYPGQLPRTILNALYSAKRGQPVGWNYSTLVELAHWIASAQKPILQLFRRALLVYDRAEQIRAEDLTGNWRRKVKVYKDAIARGDDSYRPDTSHHELIKILFPELGDIFQL
ncbi:DUF6035 family protein [Chromobacterium haemolyticum]|uniref:DUF6035 family protein n=1 Tax=Chromobacterium haemolyticum TaxID=394935 RepID=UPI0005B98360|nr:DUF6035 family protein [Chromobacterium haemolyticum]